MIKLKPAVQPQISLESIVNDLETMNHVCVGLESFPQFFGLEDLDLKGKLNKIAEAVVRMFEMIAEFVRNMWQKVFGKDESEKVSKVEAKLVEAEKIEPEVSEEVSEAIEELVKAPIEESTEPNIPAALPKQLCARLIKAHNQYFNLAASGFKFVVLKNDDWYNELPLVLIEVLNTHRVAFDSIVNDKDKTIDDYTQQVMQSSTYAKLVADLKHAGVSLDKFNYSEAFYQLNAKINGFERSPYLKLDIDANAVYKAKVGELKEGLKQLKSGVKVVDSLRNRANQMESTFTKVSKSLKDEHQIEKAKECGKHFSSLVKAIMSALRLRQQHFNANIEYIDAVISVMVHPTFKKDKK